MIKIPREMIIEKIKEKAALSDKEIESRVKDKLDKLSGLISEDGALHIIANELGVKILEDPGELQVKNVLAGMRNVEITAKVVKIYEVREFDKNNRKGKVGNFLVGDETGVIRVVAWNDKADILGKIKEGDIVKIENGYSRENRGRPEIHLGDKTKVTLPEGAKNIEVKERTTDRKRITDLTENETSVEIIGTIVQVFDPRFFMVDPETGKKVVEKEGSYFLDDKQIATPDYSYVTNVFLDDGTENIRVVLWKNQTQNLLGKSHEEILQNKDSGFEDEKNELLGKIVKFTGRTNKNEMFDRVEFIAQFVDNNPDPEAEISKLNEQLEKQQESTQEEPAAAETEEIPEAVTEETQEIKMSPGPEDGPKQQEISDTEEAKGEIEEVEEVKIGTPEPTEITEATPEAPPEDTELEEITPEDSVEGISMEPADEPEKKEELEEIEEIGDLNDLDNI